MAEARAQMKHNYVTTDERTQSLVAEVFGGLSKGKLLTALSLMHRILDADRKHDVERIVTELPCLFNTTTGMNRVPRDVRSKGRVVGAPPSHCKITYPVLNYFFSRLSTAQAKIDTTHAGRLGFTKRSCHLSPRELTVLRWMKEGKTNWEIARILGLSERTVRYYANRIFGKLDVTSRTQAVARALGAGLIAS